MKSSGTRLVRLIYASDKTQACRLSDMPEMLKRARLHNGAASISGLLCFSRDRFLQCIEGEPEIVNALYARILKDPRHARVTLIDYREVSQRFFGQWSMGYLFELDREAALFQKYFSDGEFFPHLLNGTAALDLLKGLSRTKGESRPECAL